MSTKLWYEKSENMDDVVISSRVRLARNISGIPFVSKLSETLALKIIKKVKDVIDVINKDLNFKFSFLNLKDLNKLQKLFLLERHIISPDFIKTSLPTALAVSEDESCSLMLNEEDHVRIQAFSSGIK